MIEEKNKILGLAGEVFVESYCRQNKLKYKKATHDEDIQLGIDAYINNEPTDIKNTNAIYICQILENGSINVRHPFKKNSKATHYCFVNVDGTGQGNFIEHISIKEKLLRDIIKSEKELGNLVIYLNSIDNLFYEGLGLNLNQAALKIKNEILKYCKPTVTIVYEEPETNSQLNFKIVKKKEDIKPTPQRISSIKDLIKSKLTQPEKVKKEESNNVIIIKI